ncbi:TPA: hypothetical protein N0F65_002052 [Lagenidium giganteum]|uniref:Orc1-like AAA ATPase domain-containing protein n=1 Tax=Lagenidium giganteum TaxID=4803 RepID=A0AAV2ZEC4_9STRA|nr:TPA: hypothetical protein N0F65_002052 [Lagenidium giganteum]
MIGREAQIAELERVAALHAHTNSHGQRIYEEPAPLMIIYGSASTGKSTCVASLLHARASTFAIVDCKAIFSAQEFYRQILAQLNENHGIRTSPAAQDDDLQTAIDVTGAERASHVKKDEEGLEESIHDHDDEVTQVTYNSLDFLSFVKAIDAFMERTQGGAKHKRSLYIALDHVEALLERQLTPLLRCMFSINDSLAFTKLVDGTDWSVSVLMITRAISLELDHLVGTSFPVFIYFPLYSNETIAAILTRQLKKEHVGAHFRRWLLFLIELMPPAHNDWHDFRRSVLALLPEFDAFQDLFRTSESSADNALLKKLTRKTSEQVQAAQKTRRRDLFGHNTLAQPQRLDDDQLTHSGLARSCLLLIIAGYLASFNPPEADAVFLSSAGTLKTKRQKKANAAKKDQSNAADAAGATRQVSQRHIGPKIFKLQRLLAIYLSLRSDEDTPEDESQQAGHKEAREDVFTHIRTLVRINVLERTSPPDALEDIKFRCLADTRFVHDTAKSLKFPLESYLNTTH